MDLVTDQSLLLFIKESGDHNALERLLKLTNLRDEDGRSVL